MQELSQSMLEYYILASINLILILSLTFRNISESKHIRLMAQSLQKSVKDLLIFMILVIFVLFGFVMFLTNSFGYAI